MELVTDVFQHAEDIANGSIGILHSHINYTSFVEYAVKGGMNFYAAFAKLHPDVYQMTSTPLPAQGIDRSCVSKL